LPETWNRWRCGGASAQFRQRRFSFAGIGTSLTLEGGAVLSPSAFSAVVLMVLMTTLVTLIALRWALQRSSMP
jgi:hypothetical protein